MNLYEKETLFLEVVKLKMQMIFEEFKSGILTSQEFVDELKDIDGVLDEVIDNITKV